MKYAGYVLNFTKRKRRGYHTGYDVRLLGTMNIVTVWLTTRDEDSIAFEAQKYRVVVTFEGERIKDEILDVENFDFISKEWINLARLQEDEKLLHEDFLKVRQYLNGAKFYISRMKDYEKNLHDIGACTIREQLKETIYNTVFVMDKLSEIVPDELVYTKATDKFDPKEMWNEEEN